jgi:hypothetical protein
MKETVATAFRLVLTREKDGSSVWTELEGYPESSLAFACGREGWGEGLAMHREFSPHPNLPPTERGAFRTVSEHESSPR